MFHPLGIIGGAMHIAMHAFGKITLFFCAGAIYVATGKVNVSQLNGLGKAMPFTFVAFLIGTCSVIGLPLFGGMWSKYYLSLAAADTGQLIFIAALMISSLLNVAYLIPIVARGFFRPREAGENRRHPGGTGILCGPTMRVHSAASRCFSSWTISTICCCLWSEI